MDENNEKKSFWQKLKEVDWTNVVIVTAVIKGGFDITTAIIKLCTDSKSDKAIKGLTTAVNDLSAIVKSGSGDIVMPD